MIIRNATGELLKINKYDYPNDMIYYEKIMNMKKKVTKEHEKHNYEHVNLQKKGNFFTSKKVEKKTSSSTQSICNFINVKL